MFNLHISKKDFPSTTSNEIDLTFLHLIFSLGRFFCVGSDGKSFFQGVALDMCSDLNFYCLLSKHTSGLRGQLLCLEVGFWVFIALLFGGKVFEKINTNLNSPGFFFLLFLRRKFLSRAEKYEIALVCS